MMLENSYLIGLACAVIGSLIVLSYPSSTQRTSLDASQPKEPTTIAPRVPLIGHLIGLIRDSNTYYTLLSFRVPDLPIYTINLIGNFKAYVVTSSPLVAAVHKHYKTLSFNPLLEQTAERLVGMTNDGLEKFKSGEVPERLFKGMHPVMLPGPELDAMNRIMIARIQGALDKLADDVKDAKTHEIDLYRWTRTTIGLASTDSVYGPHNPFQDSRFFNLFEDFEQNIMPLFLNFFPNFTAHTGYSAREYCVRVFTDFVRKGTKEASPMIQVHDSILLDAGLKDEDVARHGVAFALGVMGNIIPTAFWMLYHIYERPQLLVTLRSELEPLIKRSTRDSQSSSEFELDVSNLRIASTKLQSMFHEVLRHRTTLASVRFVQEDTVITAKTSNNPDQYVLKKGNILQLPAHLLHRRTDTWGTDADELRPDRFEDFINGDEKIRPVSYRAFGGGDHICPGRYFSAVEVLAFVACFIVRFDILRVSVNREDQTELSVINTTSKPGVDQKLDWKEPRLTTSMFSSSILPPQDPIPVKIIQRDDWQGHFHLSLGDANSKFKLASG